MTTYTIEITDDYVVPIGELTTNEEYLDFVINKAAESYQRQYSTVTVEEGITAARKVYNASVTPLVVVEDIPAIVDIQATVVEEPPVV